MVRTSVRHYRFTTVLTEGYSLLSGVEEGDFRTEGVAGIGTGRAEGRHPSDGGEAGESEGTGETSGGVPGPQWSSQHGPYRCVVGQLVFNAIK